MPGAKATTIRELKRENIRPEQAPPSPRNWAISPIDKFAFRWQIQGTWVFDQPIDPAMLKPGLIRLLESYPILCSRSKAEAIFEWSREGVPYVEAEDRSARVADFDASTVDVARFVELPKATSIRYGRAPVFTARLTHIRDGCVLALTASHACVDGNGFYTMARNLGLAATGREFREPVFRRPPAPEKRSRDSIRDDARDLGWHRLNPVDVVRFLMAAVGHADREFVMQFTPASLARCRDELRHASGQPDLSTNSALVAHIAYCLARLIELKPESTFAISSAVDMRGRVSGVTDEFAGNAVGLVASPEISPRASPARIAACLHESLEPFLRQPSSELEAVSTLAYELAANRLPYSSVCLSRMAMRKPTLFYTNSFTRFPVYDLNFGTESEPIRPVRAIPHNLGDPILLWPAPPETGGVELYFSGRLARLLNGAGKKGRWWNELNRFNDERN